MLRAGNHKGYKPLWFPALKLPPFLNPYYSLINRLFSRLITSCPFPRAAIVSYAGAFGLTAPQGAFEVMKATVLDDSGAGLPKIERYAGGQPCSRISGIQA